MDHKARRRGGASPRGSLTGEQNSASLLQSVIACLNARKNRILLVAQSALPEPQFKAFRTLFLDEFGQNGVESELRTILEEHRHTESDRNGQEQTLQERGCHHA